MIDLNASLTMAKPRAGWWVSVRAGEELTVKAIFAGTGSFGLLIGPEAGTWDYNRGRTGSGALVAVLAPQSATRRVWVQVTRWSASGTVAVSVSTELKGYSLPRAVEGGGYRVEGDKVVDKDGFVFPVRGANIGVNPQVGGTVYPNSLVKTPNTVEAEAWGWNTVRITTYVSDDIPRIASYGLFKALSDTYAVADAYLAAGFVVILAPMDITSGNQPYNEARLSDIQLFFAEAATRYLDESRVWFNINEPGGGINTAEKFLAFHGRFYDAVRNTGNQSIYIADVMGNAQDPIWATVPKCYDPSIGPAFLADKFNVVFGLHNYGGQGQNAWDQARFNSVYNTYGQRMVDAGLCFGTFETGYRVDGTDQAFGTADVNRNVQGFRAALQQTGSVGTLVWHATFDLFGLKSEIKNNHSVPFWTGGAGSDLSPMGQEFWDYCHSEGAG